MSLTLTALVAAILAIILLAMGVGFFLMLASPIPLDDNDDY